MNLRRSAQFIDFRTICAVAPALPANCEISSVDHPSPFPAPGHPQAPSVAFKAVAGVSASGMPASSWRQIPPTGCRVELGRPTIGRYLAQGYGFVTLSGSHRKARRLAAKCAKKTYPRKLTPSRTGSGPHPTQPQPARVRQLTTPPGSLDRYLWSIKTRQTTPLPANRQAQNTPITRRK